MRFIHLHISLFLTFIWTLEVASQRVFTIFPTRCQTSYGPTSVSSVPTISTRSSQVETYTVTTSSTFTAYSKVVGPTVTLTTTTQALLLRKETVSRVTNTVTTTTTQTRTTRTTIATSTVTDAAIYTYTYAVDLTAIVTTGPGAAAAVTPIQDTLPGSSRNRRRGLQRAGDLERRQASAQYPTAVTCAIVARTITLIQGTTTVATVTYSGAAPTVFKTVTTVQPTTSTYYASNNFPTVTSTTITTTTLSLTGTTTSTSFIESTYNPISFVRTVYPQCTGRNYANEVNGQRWAQYQPVNTGSADRIWYTINSIYTPEECCSYCLDDPTCAHTYFAYRPGATVCQFFAKPNGVCDPANPLLYNVVLTTVAPYQDAASNGKCGKWVGSVRE